MQSFRAKNPLIVILGPTAVGKTEISLELAERFHGEILSADSRLFYRGMDIGTAKPSEAERERVPHYLIDVGEPNEVWSLAVFQREARKIIAEIHQNGRLPFLVGGTGQYVRAVAEEWSIPTIAPDPRIRQALERWAEDITAGGLHERLRVVDPIAAEKIDARNVRRTVRALEVIFHTGQRFSAQRQKNQSPYELLLIGLRRPRVELYERIDRRIEAMFEAGIVDEVRGLIDKGFSPSLPSMSAIGYREVSDYLMGKITLDEAITRIKRSTRIFVRRQANWFKESDPSIHWFDVSPTVIEQIEAVIKKFIEK